MGSSITRAGRLARRAARSLVGRAAGWPVVGPRCQELLDERAAVAERSFGLERVEAVLAALERAGVPAWLGGGWGVDALFGGATRRHDDLDLVLDEVGATVEPLTRALAPLGYRRVGTRATGVWWQPEGVDLDDGRGGRIEVLGLNWELLEAAAALAGGEGRPPAAGELRARCFATGSLGGRPVPCLSARAQLLVHAGYGNEGNRPGDLALLRRLVDPEPPGPLLPGATSLVLPLLGLDGRLRRLAEAVNPWAEVPPHLSLCHPFLPGPRVDRPTLERLAELLGAVPPLEVQLDRVGWFDRRVLYLAPSAPAPLAALTAAVVAAFPGALPYGGEFEEVVPHLTLGEDLPVASLERAAARAARLLPARSVVGEAWLLAEEAGSWSVAARFPLQG